MESIKKIARNISLIENAAEGYQKILSSAKRSGPPAHIIGITGAPGAGKSTLADKLIAHIVQQNKKVAVLCVDPSSPFNMGAVLGDRIRMSQWYLHVDVYIRSLASRKALGGLSPMIIEVTEYLKYCGFDFIIIETVGVGQSEIEIAGLADVTIVTLVPEGGDEIQTMKSGVMEIADIFVVNKYDRPGADTFLKNLRHMLAPAFHNNTHEIPVIKTIAEQNFGTDELYNAVNDLLKEDKNAEKKYRLFTEKAYRLIQVKKMSGIKKDELYEKIRSLMQADNAFNIFQFVENYQP